MNKLKDGCLLLAAAIFLSGFIFAGFYYLGEFFLIGALTINFMISVYDKWPNMFRKHQSKPNKE